MDVQNRLGIQTGEHDMVIHQVLEDPSEPGDGNLLELDGVYAIANAVVDSRALDSCERSSLEKIQ